MALNLMRLATQRQLAGCYFRSQFCPSIRLVGIKAVPAPPPSQETFDERNARLKRPQSPHLTIYKPQLTSLMSVTHRATGMALGGYMVGLGLGALVCPTDIPGAIDYIQDLHLHQAFIWAGKTVIAFPAAYHFVNGIRHLLWDTGNFLTIKQVYITGYATLLASILLTAWLVTL